MRLSITYDGHVSELDSNSKGASLTLVVGSVPGEVKSVLFPCRKTVADRSLDNPNIQIGEPVSFRGEQECLKTQPPHQKPTPAKVTNSPRTLGPYKPPGSSVGWSVLCQ